MRSEATCILGLGNGYCALPCKDIRKKQITGFDAEQALGANVGTRQRRLLEGAFAEGPDAQLRIAAIEVDELFTAHQWCHISHPLQRRIGNGITKAQGQQMFGITFDRTQMRFDLPGFLGQCVEAGDDGLLFGQRRKRD